MRKKSLSEHDLVVCLKDILQLAVPMAVNLAPYLKIIENGDIFGVTCVDQKGKAISSVPSIASNKEHSHKVAESPYSYAKLRRIEDEESHQRIMTMFESSVSNVAIANTMNS
ncbi:hypothetical protein BDB01DRAFT_834829 [Pilobolus umbonatus]|nr:hypothetical protein BDB01DRAFT_834829 [Pilobolus umbonatus]